MDKLPHSLHLEILSRLNDSADVARCRVASKAFNAVFPRLRSINLTFSRKWYLRTRHLRIKPFKAVFLNLVSKLKTVESVRINVDQMVFNYDDPMSDVFNFTDAYFGKRWMPRVSGSLKSLSISGELAENALPLISSYCRNLVHLTLELVSVYNLSLIPMLTSLKLSFTDLEDELLDEMNKCFPSLEALELVDVRGLVNPKIHHLNLKTLIFETCTHCSTFETLTIITPNLVTLKIEHPKPAGLYLDAPMLSHLNLGFNPLRITVKKFENLKTLCLIATCVCSLLSEFSVTKTVEDLTVNSGNWSPRDHGESKLTIKKVFTVFPNVSYLCIKSGAWRELEDCFNLPEGCEILDGMKGMKTLCAHLVLREPLLTFSFLARVLDQCTILLEVSLLIHRGVDGTVSENFMSKCMGRWPALKWKHGTWGR